MSTLPDSVYAGARQENVHDRDVSNEIDLPLEPPYIWVWDALADGYWPGWDPINQGAPSDLSEWVPPDARIPPECLQAGEIPLGATLIERYYVRCRYMRPEDPAEPIVVDEETGCEYFIVTEERCDTLEVLYVCHQKEYLLDYWKLDCYTEEKVLEVCPDPTTGTFTTPDGTFVGTTRDRGSRRTIQWDTVLSHAGAAGGFPHVPPVVFPDSGPNVPHPPPSGPPPPPTDGSDYVWLPPVRLRSIGQQGSNTTDATGGVHVHTQQMYRLLPPAEISVRRCKITAHYRLYDLVSRYRIPGMALLSRTWGSIPGAPIEATVIWRIPGCEPLP